MSFRGALLKPSEKNGRGVNTALKSSRYEVLKEKIRTWWEDRFKVGAALQEIRDKKLYQDEHETFEAFCKSEYGFERAHAYRLIGFAEVKASVQMSPIGDKLVHESQARALAPAPEEKRVEILETVAARGPVTAKAITEVVQESKPVKAEPLTDKVGRVVPTEIIADWTRAEQIGKRLRSLASEIKTTVSEGFAGAKQDKLKDVIYAEVGNSIIADAGALSYSLGSILPYALCPSCNGHGRAKCTLCRKRGWISKFLWNSPVVNEDVKKVIGRK